MRLIDADVLKQHIDKLPALPDGNFAGSHSALKALINMQPTVQPEITEEAVKEYCRKRCLCVVDGALLKKYASAQPEQRWIPCSERLPETDEFVLVSLSGRYKNIRFEHSCEIADYADGEWFIDAYPFMMAEIANHLIEAWMPLPEPYKEGRAERRTDG